MPEPANVSAAATHADPYPFYARLVREKPFAWDDAAGAWVASSAAAVEAVLTSPLCRVRPVAEPVPGALDGTAAGDVFARLARMSDGARHLPRRAGAMVAIATLDPSRAESLAAQWTRALWTEHGGWRADAGFHLPVCVIATLLGAPESRLREVAAWTTAFVRCAAPGADAAAVARGADAAAKLMEVFGEDEIAGAPPMRALASALTDAGEPDARTAAANAIGLLFQSHDATAGLLGNAIVALGEHPQVEREVRASPALLPELIREVLRYDPPVQNTRRWVGEDGVIDGQPVRAGDPILVLLAAANRDPAVGPAADRFQLRRSGCRGFSLGHGIHACPGGALAETIAAAALRTMLEMNADFSALAARRTYLPSANGRIPLFA
ncbi:MAG TPA: cytochrome P450 [Longimicrobium sp.]|nr:cytochrome P450 [Longimicrobium sp.]